MKGRENLVRLSTLALLRRREGLAKQLPPAAEILRGSLLERYMTCGKPNCKCASGERHGPVWYLTVTLGPGKASGCVVAADQLDRVRNWIANYHKVKESLEKISDINRETLRRERAKAKRLRS